MEQKFYNHEKLVAFRHHMHENPELSFKEVNTRESIKKFLTELGISPTLFKEMAKTALVVDLQGKKEPSGKDRCIALRADMDALSMYE
jgi:metal-dependent amidase/aminoacylase/carboxypeptidase family protein